MNTTNVKNEKGNTSERRPSSVDKTKGWTLQITEYNTGKAKLNTLGTVNLTLQEIADMHPDAKFEICDGRIDGKILSPMFGRFAFPGLRPSLFVTPANVQ